MDKKTYRILILEDTPTDAELIISNLRNSKMVFEHLHTEDRSSYLGGLTDFAPDIVLSDYGLPGYTGLAAYADMRLKGQDLPFILVTGSLPDEVAVDCLKAGIDDYILKDRLSRLPEAIQGALNRKRLEQERKLTLQELVKSRHNLEKAEALAGMGNWEWDLGSGIVTWSKNLYHVLGMNPETASPSREVFFESVHPDDLQEVIGQLEAVIEGRVPTATIRCRIVTSDRHIKMIQGVYSSNREDGNAQSLKVFGTMQDVTTQFLAEKALRELTEELERRVNDRTAELSHSSQLLARRNLEMTDSLRYAKMIQQALLSDLTAFQRVFSDSFVLWIPKDIVSGDFYWYHQHGETSYVAAVDCTGHGVPGALMSAIGHQLLDRVLHDGHTEPADILRELDKGIVSALRQENGQRMQDGMDIVLCRIDRSTREVCFAGALRPLYVFSDGAIDVKEGARIAIGSSSGHSGHKQFEQQCLVCKEGDVIYLTSDGYYSQFGGPHGKKLMKNRFKDLLAEVGGMPMRRQKQNLVDRLLQWRGDEEQVDDVLVIGIRM
ncbi:MAG: SpoIIE family protein phosphatase [Flavobacteriales bacterium]|nr:SpoIIE family protein phosphatase [Flavobacteriales bacterium]